MGMRSTLTTAVWIMLPLLAFAGDTSVVTDVSLSANTGGNTGSELGVGSARIDVQVRQEINGVELPPVSVSTSASSGESRKIEIRSEYEAERVRSEVDVRGSVGPREDTEEKLEETGALQGASRSPALLSETRDPVPFVPEQPKAWSRIFNFIKNLYKYVFFFL